MASMLGNALYRVTLWCKLGEQASMNVLTYRYTNVAGVLPEQEAANDVSTWFAAAMKDLICSDASYRGITLQKFQPPPRTDAVIAVTGQGPGNAGNVTALPRQCCGLIKKTTGVATRYGRGRLYAPFPSESDNDPVNGVPTVGYRTRLDSLRTQVQATIPVTDGTNSGELQPGLISATSGFFLPLTLCIAREYWATQRRRGSYGPANDAPM